MSWKIEVELPRGSWCSNSQRFATEKEAFDAGAELLTRWTGPYDHRAKETPDEPVNYRFDQALGKAVSIA